MGKGGGEGSGLEPWNTPCSFQDSKGAPSPAQETDDIIWTVEDRHPMALQGS